MWVGEWLWPRPGCLTLVKETMPPLGPGVGQEGDEKPRPHSNFEPWAVRP
jgi:hypothetical protein